MAKKTKQVPKMPTIKLLPSGSYHCQVMVLGKRKSVTKDSYEECLSAAMELLSKRIAKSEILDKAAKGKDITLEQVLDLYIEARSNVVSPSTFRGYKQIKNHRFSDVMGKRVSSINWQMVLNDEAEKSSPKTIANAWGLVKSALTEYGYEVPKVTLPQIPKKEYVFLQPDQTKTFINAVRNERFELFFLLALHGLRCSEILALDVSKNITSKAILIRGAKVQSEDGFVIKQTNKTYSSTRDMPIIIPRVTELLKGLSAKQKQALIPRLPDVPRKHLKRICKENNLPNVGFHGLRHSFASLCYHLGISEMETMRLGGWADINVMRKIYTHLAEIDKLDSDSKLKSFFSEAK